MIQPQTVVNVVDNSGVHSLRCVHILRKRHRSFGTVGSLFVGVVISLKRSGQQKDFLKKGDLALALLVSSTKAFPYNCLSTGIYASSSNNQCVLLDIKAGKLARTFLSSRVLGAVPYLLKQKGFFKGYALGTHNI